MNERHNPIELAFRGTVYALSWSLYGRANRTDGHSHYAYAEREIRDNRQATGAAMRRWVKFLHSMGAIGLMGAMAALIILVILMPEPTATEAYANHRAIMGKIADWLLLPSLGMVLVSGLWSMALTRAFLHAGWVWIKLASGILVFKGVLLSIQGPAEQEALLSEQVLAGLADATELGLRIGEEWGVLWVMMIVAIANVVLGIWRPRMSKKHRQARRQVARRTG